MGSSTYAAMLKSFCCGAAADCRFTEPSNVITSMFCAVAYVAAMFVVCTGTCCCCCCWGGVLCETLNSLRPNKACVWSKLLLLVTIGWKSPPPCCNCVVVVVVVWFNAGLLVKPKLGMLGRLDRLVVKLLRLGRRSPKPRLAGSEETMLEGRAGMLGNAGLKQTGNDNSN